MVLMRNYHGLRHSRTGTGLYPRREEACECLEKAPIAVSQQLTPAYTGRLVLWSLTAQREDRKVAGGKPLLVYLYP